MTDYYTIDAAEARLPDVRDVLEALRDQRADLVAMRDRVVERMRAIESTAPAGAGPGGGEPPSAETDATLRNLRLRMQGVIDQMSAGVARIDEWGITLRDIETGLIDFPALVNGRPICLCWRLGEERIEWWHDLDAGFGGRRPLIELE